MVKIILILLFSAAFNIGKKDVKDIGYKRHLQNTGNTNGLVSEYQQYQDATVEEEGEFDENDDAEEAHTPNNAKNIITKAADNSTLWLYVSIAFIGGIWSTFLILCVLSKFYGIRLVRKSKNAYKSVSTIMSDSESDAENMK
mmetsp:Transcript_64121/g.78423  ORF Transcript_64121/g.78423 Transcript_64121/m.78423 type:complete len:142 (-) Transcript_64121:119-544(-)